MEREMTKEQSKLMSPIPQFIYTNDLETKEELENQNYILFKETHNGMWVFFNKDTVEFSNEHIVYSNSISF